MDINKHSPSIIPKGTFTRCIGESGQQTVISDRASHTPIAGTKSQTLYLVEGDILSYQANNSFTLHGGTTHELMDFQVIATAHKALVITILLKGKLDFGYDDLGFDFDGDMRVKVTIKLNFNGPRANTICLYCLLADSTLLASVAYLSGKIFIA